MSRKRLLISVAAGVVLAIFAAVAVALSSMVIPEVFFISLPSASTSRRVRGRGRAVPLERRRVTRFVPVRANEAISCHDIKGDRHRPAVYLVSASSPPARSSC